MWRSAYIPPPAACFRTRLARQLSIFGRANRATKNAGCQAKTSDEKNSKSQTNPKKKTIMNCVIERQKKTLFQTCVCVCVDIKFIFCTNYQIHTHIGLTHYGPINQSINQSNQKIEETKKKKFSKNIDKIEEASKQSSAIQTMETIGSNHRRYSWIIIPHSTLPILLMFVFIIFFTSICAVHADFICDFEGNHTCGYEWQQNLLPFTRVDRLPWLGSSGMLILDLKAVNVSIAPGARLMTRYYPTNAVPQACLTIKYLIFGAGITRFTIIHRSNDDRRLYEYDNDWHSAQSSSALDRYWITLTLPVDLTMGDSMFFFELWTDGFTPSGIFALDHVAFLYYRCPFKQMPHYPCLDAACFVSRRV